MLRRSWLQKLSLAFLLFVFVAGMTSCASRHTQIIGEETEQFAAYKAAYIEASEEYETTLEKYLDRYDIMPPEIQQRWKATIDPLFLTAAEILDTWERHVLSGTIIPSTQEEWLELKDDLFLMMMKEKIREQQQ